MEAALRFRVGELVNEDASLISRRCWSDQQVYELEKRGIFGKSWLFLGHESQIRNPGDFVQAYMWWSLSARQGQEGAVNNLDMMASAMNSEQIAKNES